MLSLKLQMYCLILTEKMPEFGHLIVVSTYN